MKSKFPNRKAMIPWAAGKIGGWCSGEWLSLTDLDTLLSTTGCH